jgi:CRP/FNR family cyclic AMP-dependent transcriptional regulator
MLDLAAEECSKLVNRGVFSMFSFSRNPWFQRLPTATAEALLAAAMPVRLRRGDVLYMQGDQPGEAPDGFWGVSGGAIKLSVLHADGTEVILTIIEPGNWFGESALLENSPRMSTAIAQEDSELLALSVEKFGRLMQDIGFAQAIAALEAERVRALMGALADIALHSTRARIARRLVMLSGADMARPDTERATIGISQDNIAMMLGMSRTTLSKELQALTKAGVIVLRYGRIEIRDMALLLAEAE